MGLWHLDVANTVSYKFVSLVNQPSVAFQHVPSKWEKILQAMISKYWSLKSRVNIHGNNHMRGTDCQPTSGHRWAVCRRPSEQTCWFTAKRCCTVRWQWEDENTAVQIHSLRVLFYQCGAQHDHSAKCEGLLDPAGFVARQNAKVNTVMAHAIAT